MKLARVSKLLWRAFAARAFVFKTLQTKTSTLASLHNGFTISVRAQSLLIEVKQFKFSV